MNESVIEQLIADLQTQPAAADLLVGLLNQQIANANLASTRIDALHATQTRVLNNGNPVTNDELGVARDLIGDSYSDTLNFKNNTVTRNSANPRQVDIPLGGGGADCLFDYLVSTCATTLTGFTEGKVFTSLSGCTFKLYSTVQGAYSNAGNTAGAHVIAICQGDVGPLYTNSAGEDGTTSAIDFYGFSPTNTTIHGTLANPDGLNNTNQGIRPLRFWRLNFQNNTSGFAYHNTLSGTGAGGYEFHGCQFTGKVLGAFNSQWWDCEFSDTIDLSPGSSFNALYNCQYAASFTVGSEVHVIGGIYSRTANGDAFIGGGFDVKGVSFRCSGQQYLHFFKYTDCTGSSSIRDCVVEPGVAATDVAILIQTSGAFGVSSHHIINNKWNSTVGMKLDGSGIFTGSAQGFYYIGNDHGYSASGVAIVAVVGGATFSRSIFAANSPQLSYVPAAAMGTGCRVEGVLQVTASPNGSITAMEGTFAFDTVANTLYINTDGGTTWAVVGVVGGGPAVSAEHHVISAQVDNTSLTQPYQIVGPMPAAGTITGVEAVCGENKTCGLTSAIFDVAKILAANVNTDGVGTTIFTTVANRPTITNGNKKSTTTMPDVTAFAAGDYFTFWSVQTGTNLTVANVGVRYTVP